jgi:hypothetical protein
VRFEVDITNTAAAVTWAVVVFLLAGMWVSRGRGRRT